MPAVLYVKEGCPWCEDAETELQKLGLKYERREVRSNPAYFKEMKEVSGQSKAPVLDIDGRILAEPLISARIELARLVEDGLDRLETRAAETLKVLVKP